MDHGGQIWTPTNKHRTSFQRRNAGTQGTCLPIRTLCESTPVKATRATGRHERWAAHLGMFVKSCGTRTLRNVALRRRCSLGWGNTNRTINMITLSGKPKELRSWIAVKTERA